MPQPPNKPRDDKPNTDPKAAPVLTTETMPGHPNPPVPDGSTDAPAVPPPTPPADKLTPPDAAQDGDGQNPPTDGPQAQHPPAPPDAVKDGDGQNPPDSASKIVADDDDEDDGPAPRTRTAVILLPMGDDGEPDLLGSRLDVAGIEMNYQDCAKVRVSGSARAISDLREKSEEHFRQAWNGR